MTEERMTFAQTEDFKVIQTVLYTAIEGAQSNECLVLANYYLLPFDAEEINSCVMKVKSFPDRTEWAPILQVPLWVQSVTRLSAGGFLLSSVDGILMRAIDDTIEEILLSLPSAVTAIWERANDDYWIFHGEGVVHWNGQHTLRDAFKAEQVLDMHVLSPDFAVAVGEAGLVLAFDGKRWKEIDSVPTNRVLNGVVCVAADEIYITGWEGTLYKWDGKAQWQKIKYVGSVDSSEMYGGGLACYRGTVYLCADGYGLYRIAGKKVEPVETFSASRAMVVNDKLIVTGKNMWNEYDGNEWIQVEMSL